MTPLSRGAGSTRDRYYWVGVRKAREREWVWVSSDHVPLWLIPWTVGVPYV